jgi:hypothetical protein
MEKSPLIAKYEELNSKPKVDKENFPDLPGKADYVYHLLLGYANKIKEGELNPAKIIYYDKEVCDVIFDPHLHRVKRKVLTIEIPLEN